MKPSQVFEPFENETRQPISGVRQANDFISGSHQPFLSTN